MRLRVLGCSGGIGGRHLRTTSFLADSDILVDAGTGVGDLTLAELSQIDLGKVDAYERRHQNRTTVLQRIDSLRGEEPWPGYDELTVEEVTTALRAGGEHAADVDAARDYERRHKNRSGVMEATERERAGT